MSDRELIESIDSSENPAAPTPHADLREITRQLSPAQQRALGLVSVSVLPERVMRGINVCDYPTELRAEAVGELRKGARPPALGTLRALAAKELINLRAERHGGSYATHCSFPTPLGVTVAREIIGSGSDRRAANEAWLRSLYSEHSQRVFAKRAVRHDENKETRARAHTLCQGLLAAGVEIPEITQRISGLYGASETISVDELITLAEAAQKGVSESE